MKNTDYTKHNVKILSGLPMTWFYSTSQIKRKFIQNIENKTSEKFILKNGDDY
jgi:hypothetical protein